jgi:hypothetical protein
LKHYAFFATGFAAVVAIVLPFAGGSSAAVEAALPAATSISIVTSSPIHLTHSATAQAGAATESIASTSVANTPAKHAASARPAATKSPGKSSTAVSRPDVTPIVSPRPVKHVAKPTKSHKPHVAAKPRACASNISGSTPSAPGVTQDGITGTTSGDLASFAVKMNAIRVANCLQPIPLANYHYDSCMEARLFWMAEDPSTNPMSAWGHIGSKRSDGVPSRGCDGDLAGGSGDTGATVAEKWWASSDHRASLYQPSHTGSEAHVCIDFAMTHGGIPNESYSFTRAAARATTC